MYCLCVTKMLLVTLDRVFVSQTSGSYVSKLCEKWKHYGNVCF